MSSVPGLFISFEGGEGSGKTTQIRRLESWFRQRGREVVVTREPGGSPGAEEIRNLLLTGDPGRWDAVTEALLMFASRRDHVERTIRPALAEGKVVLCDRFADSSVAYQGFGHGLGAEFIRNLWQIAIDGFKPDLTLIFDLPVEVGLERAGARFANISAAEDRFERMGTEFHQRLRNGFIEIARKNPERCEIVDANGDIDLVCERMISVVSARLSGRGI
ncbi:dTMP kinase [Thalassospira xiamenensis]|uniref:Thymidylate kinase n=1 Tax=Thalassospira xiamenensis TaxID=220697 RepID=A0A367WWC7_9PROT|nr:dTMP kinase [Thalassospira xiamenensis]KZB53818.1 thymidylate kinase [Thalassospira xiamenensis]RCK45519.1 thymidylate kinase [Thalassospira xiamenensis]